LLKRNRNFIEYEVCRRVEAGDIVMVVESDKADMDVESFDSGYLAKILVPEGSSAAVGIDYLFG
jgi:pyruvate/2-oxoglutarate dehydrogenase complex dihydrolipoamide acyltransferase (E2) component